MRESKLLKGYEFESMSHFFEENERWVEMCTDHFMDQQDRDFLDAMAERPGFLLTHYDINRVFFPRQRSGRSVIQTFQTARKIFRMSGQWGAFVHRDHRAYSSGRKQAAEHAVDMALRIMPDLKIWTIPLFWWRFGAVLIVRRNGPCKVSN